MKKLFTALLFIGFTFAAMPNGLFASDQNGTSTAVFLRMDQGARAQGMGGAFTAQSGDIECAWWNPAGPVSLGGAQFTASYNSFIEDISATYAALAIPFGVKRRNTIFVNATSLSFGSVDARDALGNSAGSISPSALVIGAGVALSLAPDASFGITAKNVQQSLGDDQSTGFAFDAGILLKISPNLNFGVSAQNMGPELKTTIKDLNTSVEDQLPENFRAGFAYTGLSKKLSLALDGEKPVDADACAHIGAEYAVSESFMIRAGYNTSSAAGFTCGVGVLTPISLTKDAGGDDSWWREGANSKKDWAHNVVRIDYAYVTNGSFGSTNRISLTLKL